MTDFNKIKEDNLAKIKHDKSAKGSIDKPILPLVNKINELPDFFTTSSCSGRISVIKDDKGITKQRDAWIFKKHEAVKVEELKNLVLPKERCSLKFETVILHIAANSIDNAFKMLKIARDSGWKKSGIISFKKNKIMLECSSTETLAMPFSKGGRMIANDELLEEFCNQANEKLEKAHLKIEKFLKNLKLLKD
ncbi:MAG: tRNA wybutosine-synthesizing protein 3 [Candidatus Woesearchaeota archaeon]|nr:tRNA wybutosine-synthesizing protein 3 [Candidatus Woesearchaeota archaeon]